MTSERDIPTGAAAREPARSRVPTLILGAAGRDFHDFNMLFRDDPATEVVAFTATQIPDIAGRHYPASLAGSLYPDGIPIEPEEALERLVTEHDVRRVLFSYSDLSHAQVMALASRCLALGAEFVLPGPARTQLRSRLPVISVCAVRTGCGKSALARWIGTQLQARGLRAGILRHPMPYGDLERQRVQRFASQEDLDVARCTVEEREEYEPHLEAGHVIHAGVDYAQVLAQAERESDLILWDGGNNDFSFVAPDLSIVLVDAWRPEQASGWHPGEAVLRSADLVVISKVDSAPPESVAQAVANVRALNPHAPIVLGRSEPRLDDSAQVRGKRVLVVEDGPTLTHGGMSVGAGAIAARAAGAAELVDPRPWAPPALREALACYPHLGPVLPALGYSEVWLHALAATIDASPAEVVVAGTPIDLARLLATARPVVRARYAFSENTPGELSAHLDAFLRRTLSRTP
ncbi:GTPase [Quisquiliibacterium transsilvanicum]|uniref:Putative GTPase n=1 Tax=Quisquiliibacterium transsilvanicum TaxID=1549638 RepID=A0A7W8MA08_9BURK|nr:GTPase [Quisquiliibacterium transsilvanicum]MBB5272905.1 putative GTPase [Quisquiliibacterium transsilvanicum]